MIRRPEVTTMEPKDAHPLHRAWMDWRTRALKAASRAAQDGHAEMAVGIMALMDDAVASLGPEIRAATGDRR